MCWCRCPVCRVHLLGPGPYLPFPFMVALRGSCLWATRCVGAWNLQLSPQRHMHGTFQTENSWHQRCTQLGPKHPGRSHPAPPLGRADTCTTGRFPGPRTTGAIAWPHTPPAPAPSLAATGEGTALPLDQSHTHMRNRWAPTSERPSSPQPPCAVATGTYRSPVPPLSPPHPLLLYLSPSPLSLPPPADIPTFSESMAGPWAGQGLSAPWDTWAPRPGIWASPASCLPGSFMCCESRDCLCSRRARTRAQP